MNDQTANSSESVVLAIDLQPSFLAAIPNADEVLRRSAFLLDVARFLEVPVLATTQVAPRMGGLDREIGARLGAKDILDKQSFSCAGNEEFLKRLERSNQVQIVVCGIETHICVCQTTLDLLASEFDVFVVADAVSARSREAHEIGLRRMSDSGAFITHSESVAYEWLEASDHPRFREVLELVKSSFATV
ncbi:MAG TPA: isochorismatase family protein [Fimbriimonadaceae bacterium]|nr:isochorismatase family protein [Fimbriimonadaceae bacterium]HRJ95593.1 isochorismatase family protein [Fimbriimonadaceae bacterium]